jgi:molybdopterin synthase catalytic subunit
MVKISAEPIDPAVAYELISTKNAGSIVFHYAVVKPQESSGGTTCYIDYGANGDVEAELSNIADKIAGNFSIEDILLIRRTGRLGLGEIISLVAASSPNSEAAFEACKLGISCLKKMKTIVKNEVCDRPAKDAT